MEFIPKTDSRIVHVELDKGTVLKETDKVARDIESRLSDIPEIETVFVNVGGASMMGTSSSEVAQMQVMLVDKEQRQRSSEQVADDIRQSLQDIPGADISVTVSQQMMGGMMATAPISIALKGDDLDVLKSMAEEIKEVVASVPHQEVSPVLLWTTELQVRWTGIRR